MKIVAAITLAAFGFFQGSNILLHYITGYLAACDFPLELPAILSVGAYFSILTSGILAYKGSTSLLFVSVTGHIHTLISCSGH